MNEQLQKKVDFAIRLLQGAEKMAEKVGQPVEICYSGGKDSDVILELARMSGIKYRAIYKNTTIDPPGTIKHALDNGCEVRRPSMSFREVIEKAGFPSRWRRICCEKLKEYKILDYAVVGVRREESIKRAQRYKEPEMCRVYSKSVKARHYLPLLEWTSQDVADFISERGIQCHPLYYDGGGNFHPERRLGCMGCPLAKKSQRIQEFRDHPGLIRMWLRAGQKYLDTHPNNRIAEYYNDVYEWMAMQIFCDTVHEFKEKFGPNLFYGKVDCKKYLEDYFNFDLTL